MVRRIFAESPQFTSARKPRKSTTLDFETPQQDGRRRNPVSLEALTFNVGEPSLARQLCSESLFQTHSAFKTIEVADVSPEIRAHDHLRSGRALNSTNAQVKRDKIGAKHYTASTCTRCVSVFTCSISSTQSSRFRYGPPPFDCDVYGRNTHSDIVEVRLEADIVIRGQICGNKDPCHCNERKNAQKSNCYAPKRRVKASNTN